ncbi:triose-phosphate isomerase [Bacillus cereus]|uniref:triose-phosphate isomerase n=1 Tax=Bacillus cereus TaxID=1396 RepID=UPI002ABEDDD5|nr:triose-phosphate isomerase [Bacillus cereus]MDA2491370.1 triose-phosphate isomerase [Bacillus cereus]MDZ4621213.1 triose-phosphate isomerase [Bacillus cereus]
MLCVINLKSKMDIDMQEKFCEQVPTYGSKHNILIAPTLPIKNNKYSAEIISQNISIKKRIVGEISPNVLKKLGINYTMVGHLERRKALNEDISIIKQRLENALDHNIVPILCIGITNNPTEIVEELNSILKNVFLENKKVIIAYECIESTIKGIKCYNEYEIMCIFKEIKRCMDELKRSNFNFEYQCLFGGCVGLEEAEMAKNIGFDGILIGDRYSYFDPINEMIKVWSNE